MRTNTDAGEQGTLIVKALEMAMDKDFMGAAHGHAAEELVGAASAATEVTAETSVKKGSDPGLLIILTVNG